MVIIINSAKKFGPEGFIQDFGYQARKGDIIGVLFEYKSDTSMR